VTELEWSWFDDNAPRIVDVVGFNEWPGWEPCNSRSPGYGEYSTSVVCTRMTGHSGRHAAGTGAAIIAVWL
jgi:hypothetical protein